MENSNHVGLRAVQMVMQMLGAVGSHAGGQQDSGRG